MEDGSKREIRENPREWEQTYQKARELKSAIWKKIEKIYGIDDLFKKWTIIIDQWEESITGDYQAECATKERLKEYYRKKDLVDNLAVLHAALSSSTNSKLSPQADLSGDDSLIKFLEEVLEQFKSDNPPAYLDEE